MSEFTVTVFRFAFFIILWLFVLGVAGVLKRDIFGARKSPRKSRRGGKASRNAAPNPAPSRPAPAPAPTPAPARSQAHPGSVRVIGGPLTGTLITLSGAPVTFGRAPDNSIVINDDFASSHHARIVAANGSWVLEDLGSTNGTIVDGSRMHSPISLRIGTQITIGHTTLETQS